MLWPGNAEFEITFVDWKNACNLKVESYFIWWECLETWREHPRSSEKTCSKEAGGGIRLSLQQREQAVWTPKIRYQTKEFSILCKGRCKPLDSLNSLFSYAPQLSGPILFPSSPCFLHSPSSSAITVGGWQHPCDHSFGSPHSHVEARNCWWLWHSYLLIWKLDIFISQY